MMITFVAVGICSPADDVIGVEMDWKGKKSKDLFSGMDGKANGWSIKGKEVAANVGTVAGLFSAFWPSTPSELGDGALV